MIEMRQNDRGPSRRAQRKAFQADARDRAQQAPQWDMAAYQVATQDDLADAYAALARPEPDYTFGGVATGGTAEWIAATYQEAAADYARAEAG